MNLSTALWKADSLRTTAEGPLRVSSSLATVYHLGGCFRALTGRSLNSIATVSERPSADPRENLATNLRIRTG
jgi:hypothetical protein